MRKREPEPELQPGLILLRWPVGVPGHVPRLLRSLVKAEQILHIVFKESSQSSD